MDTIEAIRRLISTPRLLSGPCRMLFDDGKTKHTLMGVALEGRLLHLGRVAIQRDKPHKSHLRYRAVFSMLFSAFSRRLAALSIRH